MAGNASLLTVNTIAYPAYTDTVDVVFDPFINELSVFGLLDQGEILDRPGSVPLDGLSSYIGAGIGPGGVIGATGGSGVVDGAGFSAVGALTDFGFAFGSGTDTLQFLFDVPGLEIEALATPTGEFGDTPFFEKDYDEGEAFVASGAALRIERVGVIPLPAGGLLLATALGGLVLRRRL